MPANKNKKFKQDESSITDQEEDKRNVQQAANITNIINNNNINNFIISDPT